MKLRHMFSMSAVALAISANSYALDGDFSSAQQKQIEKIVHSYIVKNPEVLIEASQALQEKQQKNMQKEARKAIDSYAPELFKGKYAIAGNVNGDVTMVEFFDYQCVHCKKMKPVVNALIKSDKNLKVIYKEFPIFGKTSELASRVALAAGMQGKYLPMQTALLDVDKRLTEKLIMNKAKAVGLNMNKLQKDMNSDEVKSILESNRKLAENMHLMGTPAFVIGATPKGQYDAKVEAAFIPGAASEATLQELVTKARKSA